MIGEFLMSTNKTTTEPGLKLPTVFINSSKHGLVVVRTNLDLLTRNGWNLRSNYYSKRQKMCKINGWLNFNGLSFVNDNYRYIKFFKHLVY